ncbi:hypothetical protein CAEBREN_15146 [Caenorhabditis brenneri]|uniref:Uncharacterized protein n=1 Tax=Caenorhabditis brenneri TaxID=135651 RepID=G0N253_CAEBE|nr:hypothetical protein CAEBREN_15146 [Caenorhabditis brenneri]
MSTTTFQDQEILRLRTELRNEMNHHQATKCRYTDLFNKLVETRNQAINYRDEAEQLRTQVGNQAEEIGNMKADAVYQSELLEQTQADAESLESQVETQHQEMQEMKDQLTTRTSSFIDGFLRFDKELKEAQAQVQSQARDLKNTKALLQLAQADTQAQKDLVAQTLDRAEKAEQAQAEAQAQIADLQAQAQKFDVDRAKHKAELKEMITTQEEAQAQITDFQAQAQGHAQAQKNAEIRTRQAFTERDRAQAEARGLEQKLKEAEAKLKGLEVQDQVQTVQDHPLAQTPAQALERQLGKAENAGLRATTTQTRWGPDWTTNQNKKDFMKTFFRH